MTLRRQFLIKAPAGLLALGTLRIGNASGQAMPPAPMPAPIAAPPLPAASAVTASTFSAAENLMQVHLSEAEREQAAQSWATSMAPMLERRTGPHPLSLGPQDIPAMRWTPLQEIRQRRPRNQFLRSAAVPRALPQRDEDIAYAPVTALSRWIATRQLSSERLTRIYLARIARFDAQLRSVITLMADSAMKDARQADRDIAAGRYRGPLHGIPYGVKDLLDTAGVATTWGAEPYRNRVPTTDATVVSRLHAAGAILLAKLSLGALALNDIWFGGQTMNPWLPQEGASGSSAGPGAATAAALVAFSIGSETEGSIVSPSMRCGLAGLRPTFGRVPRGGAMTLCWSLDKLGPMTRSVEDAMLVLHAIAGPDAADPASVAAPLDFDAGAGVRGLKVGYFPGWMNQDPANEVDRNALAALTQAGLIATPVTLPDWPYGSLNLILMAEAAAAFEDITLDGRAATMRVQTPDAWPNQFRQARFLSAVDLIQADRLRRKVALEMRRLLDEVDVLLVPSLRDEMLTISNFTGHPSLTVRTGFIDITQARSDWAPYPAQPLPKFSPPRRVPHGVTLVGRLFDEGTLAQVGLALERSAAVADARPAGF